MSELEKEKAEKLAERAVRKNTELEDFQVQGLSPESANNIFRVDKKYFVKIEKWHGMRRMMYLEPVLLENTEIPVKTPELHSYGHIDGYIYRIFEYIDAQSLDKNSEKTFYDQEKLEQKDKLRRMGEALARIHESREFERHGLIQTIDGEIQQASADNWFKGLKDIQVFWHDMLEDEGFEDEVEKLDRFYRENREILESRTESKLIHQEMDFRNILFADEGLTVVDWESAAAGDPLMDLAVLETIIFWMEQQEDRELKEALRSGYRNVRPLELEEDLYDIYRVVELSRLLYVFHEDDELVERIQRELDEFIQ